MADDFFTIELKPKGVAARFASFASLFIQESETTHKVGVLSVLNKMVYWSRVDTGRMRAGFFAYADSRGYSLAASLVNFATVKADQEKLGRKEGQYQDGYLRTRIINAVKYIGQVDDKVGIFYSGTFASKLAVFERIYGKKFQEFFEAADAMNTTGKAPRQTPDAAGEN